MSDKPVRYAVSWPQPHSHQFHVVADFPAGLGETLTLRMPAWNPGSYLIREFARHVSHLEASVPVEKVEKDTWKLTGTAKGCRVTYRVYANELTVRTCHLDDTHAFFNGVGMFLFGDQTRARAVELTLDVPDGWRVCTGLSTGDNGAFVASDYDELVDCPVEAGTHETISFAALDVPHEVAMWGQGNYDADILARDLTAIVEESAEIFGGALPYSRYAFITHLSDGRGGGLEHHNTSVLNYPQLGFQPEKKYFGFLELATHELFHVWNVKRIKPSEFIPYDYSQENYTTLLWAMEGITDYYALLICVRAGVTTIDHFLETIGQRATRLARSPGRHVHTLEDSSRDTWIKLYRPDENSINSTISYYLKGSLVALALDLEIRKRSKHKKSLDDVLRALWERAQEQRGVDRDEIDALIHDATGVDVSDLLDAYVRGTNELDLAAHLQSFGIELHARASDNSQDKGGTSGNGDDRNGAWLGANLHPDGKGRLIVQSVLTASPAESAGLYAGDQMLAMDGWKTATVSAVDAHLDAKEPGDVVEVSVFRRDRLLKVDVALSARPNDTFWAQPGSEPDTATSKAFQAWLHHPHPSASVGS